MKKLCALLLALALPLGWTADSARAQDVRYTTVSEVEFGGTLGRLMSLVPGADMQARETTSISGPRMRVDTEGSSTVWDWESGRFVSMDHGSKTYWEMSLADFTRGMGQMAETMRQSIEEARAEADAEGRRQAPAGDEEAAARLDIELSTDRTGDSRTISGFDTERVFVTMVMEAEGVSAAQDPERPDLEQGRIVFLTELWLTEDPLVPTPENLDTEGFREMTGGAMEEWTALEQAFANDPELQVAFDRSRAAMDDLEGTAVESTLYWVVVPPEMEFDRQKVLDQAEESLSADLAEGAREGAEQAVRSGLGRIGGMFGGGGGDEEEAEELDQVTFLRVKTRIENVERGGVPASTFEVPQGYTKREIGVSAGGAGA